MFTLILSCLLVSGLLKAQTVSTIKGTIRSNTNKETLPAVSVLIKGTSAGTFSDQRGNFRITTTKQLPIILVLSSVGFASREISVTETSGAVQIMLDETSVLAQDIVVSASRLPQRVLESPVTIDRINASAIRNSPATSYYDIVGNLKGVDIVTSSLTFKTPSTRGFNGSGNLRLNQLVDGMDNQAPGLNFAVGSMIGPTDLDVENLELLGGASSALYDPGGMNGTLLINSKNPFKYQGLSVQLKEGIMYVSDNIRKPSAYSDISFRYGKALSEKFAFKAGGQYIYAKDWVARDYSNFNRGQNPATGTIDPRNRTTEPNYNGVNVYGDETSLDLSGRSTPFLKGVIAASPNPDQLGAILAPYLAKPFFVSRTGYNESDVIDPTTKNLRLSGGLYYKLSPAVEASLAANWGSGTTVYTESDRYSLKDFRMAQYKLEVRHKNWFVRAYTTQEDAGKSYNATVTAQLFNEGWKRSYDPANARGSWYPQYAAAFATAAATVYQQAFGAAIAAGKSQAQAATEAQKAVSANTGAFNQAARKFADVGKPLAGSPQFNQIFAEVAAKPISNGGGLFIDKSSLYMAEGQYNLSDKVKLAEVLVGANFKEYVLNSKGTVFADTAGRINIKELGAYALISKKLFKDILNLTASGRYDKNDNF